MADQSARTLEFPPAGGAVELRHLRSFVAVAEELNFGRAAERLYITQPALSRQIAGLEQAVGCELLRRSTRRVELTLAGEALLDRARPLLRDADDAVLAAQSVGGEIMARIARMWKLAGAGESTDLEDQRAAFEALHAQFEMPAGVQVRPSNAGGVAALIIDEESSAAPPGILYLHGGAFVVGSAFGYRPLAGALARACRRGVLVPDYRLAPEHPFPAALDDARTAYQWMLERGGDPARIVLAGDSTGAGLAVALLLRLRDLGLPLPAGAALLCPAADLTVPSFDPDPEDALLQTFSEFWRGCIASYVGDHRLDDPLVSPALGDLSGLPPLLIQGGTGDLFFGESETLAARAREHGVETQLELFAVDAHAFQMFWPFLPDAADALDSLGDFVRARTDVLGGAAVAG
jgi:epsilon-lactone hydrolase